MIQVFFWQNVNSIHQSAFFNALAKTERVKVFLIVTEALAQFRQHMGWSEPALDTRVQILRFEQQLDWRELLEKHASPQYLHIFSGIQAFPNVHKAFRYAMKCGCRMGVLSESLDLRGKRGFLRKFRGYYHCWLYQRKLSFLLAIGQEAYQQFLLWGYPERKVFEWAYTVEQSSRADLSAPSQNYREPFKILFVGSLILRKGYDILINALRLIADKPFVADFYCLKPEDLERGKRIEEESKLGEKLHLYPFLANQAIREKMAEYDLLVLPSRRDGWGAVVSESLMEGLPVLVSSFSGAGTLVQDASRGGIIGKLAPEPLAAQVSVFIQQGKWPEEKRQLLKKWSETHISGPAMSNYFLQLIDHLNDNKMGRPKAPWN